MIGYKKTQFPDLTGKHKAVVTDISVEANMFYNSEEKNSTTHVLTIGFDLTDEKGRENTFSQRFIPPLVGGSGIFQALLDFSGITPEEAGEVDEQKFLFSTIDIEIAKNKKGYNTIIFASGEKNEEEKKKAIEKKEAEAIFS